jgi:dipeptidyl aminopeptidase/acylaminoacyl peptidase
MHKNRIACALALCAALVVVSLHLHAQTEPKYLTPPKVIVDILDARPTPQTVVSPARNAIAVIDRHSMPTIADLAQPMLRLAGTRINPRTNGLQRTSGVVYAITLKSIADGTEVKVTMPPSPNIGSVMFSPDGKRLAFTQTTAAGISLWIADSATGLSRQATAGTLNGTPGAPCDWMDDSKLMLCGFVSATRGLPPVEPNVPRGPNIQENTGKAAPAATYEDLLKTAYDDTLFEYYFTRQLALVDVTAGTRTLVGKPGLFDDASLSPDGQYLLVSRLRKPFSHLVTSSEFAKNLEVWNRAGELVKTIAEIPSGEGVPMMGVRTGPRSYRWHPLEPATIVWVEATDGGDLRAKAEFRDRVVGLAAPFTGQPAEIMKTQNRAGSLAWTEAGVTLVSETTRGAKRMRITWMIDKGGAPRKIWEVDSADRYNDPGTPVMRVDRAEPAILQAGDTIYLQGTGASPQGDHPFLARYNLKTLTSEKIWQCQGESYETVVALLSNDAKTILTRYETPKEVPNLFVREVGSTTRRQLTLFGNPAPQLAGVQKQFITYKRKDGVDLNGTLYLPPGYQKGQKLPLVMWAYPREFTDAATAAQVTGSPYRFTTVSGPSHMFLLLQGYAVLDDPKLPIIGSGETANDTYVEQLVSGAQAAIDKVVEMGVADRDRIGVGGHSYGAFMTANLLAHSRLFRAGVARSGAYNRTLTPFGFQSEERTFWEIPDVYMNMSPFRYADRIKDAILLIHGEADNNSGTFPIQSERMYMALKGHGATVRYVTLPLESHGYSARESVLHTLAEMINWFDKYVKGAAPRGTN